MDGYDRWPIASFDSRLYSVLLREVWRSSLMGLVDTDTCIL